MTKYNHPLLQAVDYSQTKDPAMEMMLDLYRQTDSLDLNPYLTKLFEMPLFDWIADIQLDEGNEQFKFVRKDGKTWTDFPLAEQRQYVDRTPGVSTFVITMADSTSGLVGGYYLNRSVGFTLVFDRLLWEACGQPLDGRGFRMMYEGDRWQPAVVEKDFAFLLSDGNPYKEIVPYFPDQQVAKNLAADFSLRSICPQECRLVSDFDLQMVEAVRQQPGGEEFSFADWRKVQADMKQQLKSSPTATLLQLPGILPLPTWGAVDAGSELHLCVQIPGRGWQSSPADSILSHPLEILYHYVHARPKSDFYRLYSKETLLTAIESICTCLGICSNLKLKDVPYLVIEWREASDIWFGGGLSKLAQILVDNRLEPLLRWTMRSPNAHLLRDTEIDKWLPADFEVTDKNKEGFRAFLIGVLNDLRDLTAEHAAKLFKECLCSAQAQQVKFEKMAGEIQMLDLMNDSYFDRGRCSFSWWFCSDIMDTHARRCYDSYRSWGYWSEALLPFSWKEQVVLDGFVFQLPKSKADWAKAGQYCGLEEPEAFPLGSGRIPPVIVSLADSPRVPIGIVEPLSTEFELSEEFYDTLNESREQFNERFRQIVEQYWEIFDKKYPYLY